jgi:peptide/nickel transport system substrate-binding protein
MFSAAFLTVPLRRWVLVSLAVIVAIALGACSPTDFKTEAAQVPQIVVSTLSDPKTFNYPLSQESPSVFTYIYEGLITENGNGEIEPALAESWKISDDKRQIVFTLRDGLKWSDGEPLTADDITFTYNDLYFNEKIPTDARDILRIGTTGALPTVSKIDDRHVKFTVPEPFAPFLRITGLPILPRHTLIDSVKQTGSDGNPKFLSTWGVDTDPRKIIANGPYLLAGYTPSQRVIFQRNPYYWRKDAQGNALPYIERFIWQIVESTDTSLLQFRSGGLDALGISPENFSLLKGEEKRGKFTIYNGGPAAGTNFISFNLNKARRADGRPIVDPIKSKWFNTLAFRQAVAYALDRQTMINNTFRGLGSAQDSPISLQSPYYLSAEEGLKVYNYDPEKAKQLLREAGFKYNSQGQLQDAEGHLVRFTLITNSGNKIREAMGAQVKQDLQQIGIQVDFNPINFNTLVEKLSTTRDWDCYLLGLTGGVEPNDGANVWLSRGGLHSFNQGPLPGQPAIQGWEPTEWEKELDRLYIQGAQELDETKRKAIYAKTQQITQEQVPVIYLVNPLSLSAVRDRIQGVKFTALGGSLWNIYELKLTE